MGVFDWKCENCYNTIPSFNRNNFIVVNGMEKVLCENCIPLFQTKSKDEEPKIELDDTAFEDLFQMQEFSNLKKELEERLKHSQNDGYQAKEEYDTLSQYKYKEKEEGEDTVVSKEPSNKRPSVEDALAKLDALVGLPNIKKSIKELLQSFEGQKRLYEIAKGTIKIEKPTLHMSFTGSDGTGKREVAKVLTEILFAAGHINENKYIETDRSGLVGEHVGSTAPKVLKKVKEALGGVLFVHEANTLVSENGKDFGKEAISTLAKEMENNRENLVVILAGVESEMNNLFQQFPSLASSITNRFSFLDYTPKQLSSIAKKMLEDKGYNCTNALEEMERAILLSSKNGAVEGNGRFVRNFVQKIVQQHMVRFSKEEPENFEEISAEDVQQAFGVKSKDEQEGLKNVKEAALNELNALIGLEELKTEANRIMNYFAISKRKFEKGLSSSKPTMHMIFSGPPGTGKTTVAKIFAQFLKGEGILSNGHLKEVSRADLVGSHVGETALKVKKVFQESIGGILFIDEAYSLDGGDKDSFGQEAIDTLIKEMEENRGNQITILAGYDNDMERLLEKNAGFKSRVAYTFDFPDYNVDEIMQIVDLNFSKHKLEIDEETKVFLKEKLTLLADENLGVIEGNGRWVRNFMDKLQIAQSNRIMNEGIDDLTSIKKEDITEALEYLEKF